jgi:hypothetical protein
VTILVLAMAAIREVRSTAWASAMGSIADRQLSFGLRPLSERSHPFPAAASHAIGMQKRMEAALFFPCGEESDLGSLAERSAGSDAKCRKSQQRRYLPAARRMPDMVKCRKFKGRKGRSRSRCPEPAPARSPPAHRRGRPIDAAIIHGQVGLASTGAACGMDPA